MLNDRTLRKYRVLYYVLGQLKTCLLYWVFEFNSTFNFYFNTREHVRFKYVSLHHLSNTMNN